MMSELNEAEAVAGAVDSALDQMRVRQAIVIVPALCPGNVVNAIRQSPRVADVLVSAAPKGNGEDGVIASDGVAWSRPSIAADALLVVGGLNSIRPGALLTFAKWGYWRIGFVDPATHRFAWKAWSVLLVRKALVGVYNRSETVRRFLPWMRNQIVHPVYGIAGNLFFWRALRHVPSQSRDNSKGPVLLVIGTLGAGGSERQVVNTALGLKERYGLEPIVACLNLSGEAATFYQDALESCAIECIDLSVVGSTPDAAGRARSLSRVGIALHPNDAGQIGGLHSIMERYRPAVVHSFLDQANVKAGLIALICGVPRIVLSTRSVAPDNFWKNVEHLRFAYRRLLPYRSVVMCNNSQAGADDYRRWLSLPRLHMPVIPNGIDLSAFEPQPDRGDDFRRALGVPLDALVVGGVMRFTEEKQPELWARAAVEMSRHRADIHFVLAGDGPLLAEVRQIFERARIMARVHILGRIRDVQTVYRALDLFLLTSRKEGLPNALIEAQAVGVPVVTTPAGGAGEALEHGLTGYIIDGDDPRAVAKTCLSILNDDALRASMGGAGSNWVREGFAPEKMLKEVVALYGL